MSLFDHEYYRDQHMTSLVELADAQAFAAAASKNRKRVADDVLRFTSVSPISFMTEVVGAFDA